MPLTHLFLTLLVVLIWGINFLFVKCALTEISPILLCALRFLLASIPAVFFIKPPQIAYKTIIWYGLIMFALQFSLLFMGMHTGMTPGMGSLIMQVQVFFSMFFAALLLNEKPHAGQIIGALVSFMGIAVVAMHVDANVSLTGIVLILAAAATWGYGNLITRKTNNINMVALVVWGSFVAFIPLFCLSFIFEGSENIIASYQHLTWFGGGSLFYIVYVSTWVGYGLWNWLLGRYPVSVIVPYTLLIPLVGIVSSILIMGEPFQFWKLIAGLLVISGLCINVLSSRLRKRYAAKKLLKIST